MDGLTKELEKVMKDFYKNYSLFYRIGLANYTTTPNTEAGEIIINFTAKKRKDS